jgi:acyl carrier protein
MTTKITNSPSQTDHRVNLSQTEIQAWLVNYMAENLEVDPQEIDINLPFDSYNIDSAVTIGMAADLEILLNTILDPTIVYEYPTIKTLSQCLSLGGETAWQKDLHR